MLQVLAERVVARQRVLDRDEARPWVAHEGHEEQAGVEPPERIIAVREGVAPAKHPGAAVERRMGQPDVRVGRHQRLPVGAGRSEVGLGELGPARQRGAVAFGAADDRLLLAQRGAVPGLDHHPDPADGDVRPAGQPARAGIARLNPDVALDVGRLLGLDVRGAVLEPEQVPGRGLGCRRGRGPTEAELRPTHARAAKGGPGEVADRVHGDLRIVGARLDEQVAVAAARVELVAREVGEPDEAGREPLGQAESVGGGTTDALGSHEQRPSEPDRDRESGRRQVERLAGVVGRRVAGAAGGPERSGCQPCRETGRHRRPPAEQVDQLGARRRRQVERGRVHAVLRGRHDPGLVCPGERVRPAAGGGRVRSRGRGGAG